MSLRLLTMSQKQERRRKEETAWEKKQLSMSPSASSSPVLELGVSGVSRCVYIDRCKLLTNTSSQQHHGHSLTSPPGKYTFMAHRGSPRGDEAPPPILLLLPRHAMRTGIHHHERAEEKKSLALFGTFFRSLGASQTMRTTRRPQRHPEAPVHDPDRRNALESSGTRHVVRGRIMSTYRYRFPHQLSILRTFFPSAWRALQRTLPSFIPRRDQAGGGGGHTDVRLHKLRWLR